MQFHLEGHEYIQLNQLLKFMDLAQSGGDANQLIAAGQVLVNGAVETQKRKKLRSGDVVEFEKNRIEVKP